MSVIMKKFLFFSLLCLFSLVLAHSKKDKEEVKKIVKIIEFDKEDDNHVGPRRRYPKKKHFHSSSSWSSEEYRRRRGQRRRQRPQNDVRRRACDDGWLEFQRPNGPWCILIGDSQVRNGYFSQQDAQNQCAAKGATLTGFQNDNERMTVANEAYQKLVQMGGQVAGLWLGATNLPNCRSPSCGPYNTFQWTDGDTTGVAGLKWGIGEPDNNNWPGSTACIQQFIISPNFVAGANEFAGWKGAFANGDLDKYQCTSQAYPFTRLYACGKRGYMS